MTLLAVLLATIALAGRALSAGLAAPPLPPTALRAARVTASTIRLAWSDNANSETHFLLRYRPANRVWPVVVRLPADTESWVHRGLQPDTAYYYQARACRGPSCSAYSATLRARTRPRADAPTIAGCPVFPPDNPWNTDVSAYPVHPSSRRYISSINTDDNTFLHADFGENQDYGIPYTVVPGSQPKVPITFTLYGDESDPGPYPVPPDAPVEAGSDHHVIVVDRGACQLYELWQAQRAGRGWRAGSGAVFDLRSNRPRPDYWTSADAAGLPIFAGLVRFEEVQSGRINHALRFTVNRTQRGFIHPATHFASESADPDLPPMGLRLRLKQDYDISRFRGQARVILEALQRYGMIVADNGASWFISGATDPRWDDQDLNQLKTVPGTAFEAVYTGPIIGP